MPFSWHAISQCSDTRLGEARKGLSILMFHAKGRILLTDVVLMVHAAPLQRTPHTRSLRRIQRRLRQWMPHGRAVLARSRTRSEEDNPPRPAIGNKPRTAAPRTPGKTHCLRPECSRPWAGTLTHECSRSLPLLCQKSCTCNSRQMCSFALSDLAPSTDLDFIHSWF